MKPQEIREREFVVTLRGYDQDEVRAFLDELATELETADEPPAGRFDEFGRATARVLAVAEESAQEITEAARSDAERIVAEADERARRLVAEAETAAREVRDEAEQVREQAREELRQATAEREELGRLREEHAAAQRRSLERIRRAGGETSRALRAATEPSDQVLHGVEEARRLVDEHFEAADAVAADVLARSEEVLRTLEAELPAVDGTEPLSGSARGRLRDEG